MHKNCVLLLSRIRRNYQETVSLIQRYGLCHQLQQLKNNSTFAECGEIVRVYKPPRKQGKTQIKSNLQYKQVSPDTPEIQNVQSLMWFIHMRHQLPMQQILAVNEGCLYIAYQSAANTQVVCRFDEGFTFVTLAVVTVSTFALKKS